MFRSLTNNMKERVELVKNSMSKKIAEEELQKCESLEEYYWFAKKVQNGICAQMELYILENYEKIPLERWNSHSFKIHPHTGTKTLFFGKKDKFKKMKNEALSKLFKRTYDKSIKITSINFVLDENDGDFSVDFNNGSWMFIYENEILTYYYTIKNYLTDETI